MRLLILNDEEKMAVQELITNHWAEFVEICNKLNVDMKILMNNLDEIDSKVMPNAKVQPTAQGKTE